MLWDLIRDFFVQHIFGGHTSGGVVFRGLVGHFTYTEDGSMEVLNTADLYLPFKAWWGGDKDPFYNMCFGDWLSTTATMISITIIVVLCCLFVYKIIKLIGGLIR